MFTLLKTLTVKQFFAQQLPAAATAWIIAEMFYKFHSFTLECAAFLATWFVLDALLTAVWRLFRGPAQQASQG